jgi:hypothetical protein
VRLELRSSHACHVVSGRSPCRANVPTVQPHLSFLFSHRTAWYAPLSVTGADWRDRRPTARSSPPIQHNTRVGFAPLSSCFWLSSRQKLKSSANQTLRCSSCLTYSASMAPYPLFHTAPTLWKKARKWKPASMMNSVAALLSVLSKWPKTGLSLFPSDMSINMPGC